MRISPALRIGLLLASSFPFAECSPEPISAPADESSLGGGTILTTFNRLTLSRGERSSFHAALSPAAAIACRAAPENGGPASARRHGVRAGLARCGVPRACAGLEVRQPGGEQPQRREVRAEVVDELDAGVVGEVAQHRGADP